MSNANASSLQGTRTIQNLYKNVQFECVSLSDSDANGNQYALL